MCSTLKEMHFLHHYIYFPALVKQATVNTTGTVTPAHACDGPDSLLPWRQCWPTELSAGIFVLKTKQEHSFLCMHKFAWAAQMLCVCVCTRWWDHCEKFANSQRWIRGMSLFIAAHYLGVMTLALQSCNSGESYSVSFTKFKAGIDFLTTRRLGLCSIFKSSRRESLNVGWGGCWETTQGFLWSCTPLKRSVLR